MARHTSISDKKEPGYVPLSYVQVVHKLNITVFFFLFRKLKLTGCYTGALVFHLVTLMETILFLS